MDSILDSEIHARLIQDLEGVCSQANVLPQFVHQSATLVCGPEEIDWIRKFPQYRLKYAGLLLIGGTHQSKHCQAIAGALLRNYLDARVMTLNEVIETKPDPTVLLIPNLCFPSYGKTLAAHELQTLYDLLIQRQIAGRPTVACVESMDAVKSYGSPMLTEHLTDSFKKI